MTQPIYITKCNVTVKKKITHYPCTGRRGNLSNKIWLAIKLRFIPVFVKFTWSFVWLSLANPPKQFLYYIITFRPWS